MPQFSRTSKARLDTCHDDIQDILNEAIKYYDFSVVCGHRDMEAQNRAFDEGNSQLRWPQSRHNTYPSTAVDIIPYPTGYDDINEFYKMATFIFAVANELEIPLQWGGHWKSFKDYPHFELKDI